jgi:peptidyl-prolyl cis-trans isomerase C
MGGYSSYGIDDSEKVEEKSAEKKEGKKGDPSEKKVVGDPIVVKVGNSKVVRRSEVLEAMTSLPEDMRKRMSYDQVFKATRERLVRTYLLSEAGKKSGAEKNPEVQKKLEEVKGDLIAQHYLMQEIQKKITEPAMQTRYKKLVTEYPKGKECQLLHILVQSEEKAKSAVARLVAGEDFAKVAKEESLAPSKDKGGDEGYVMPDMLPPNIKEKVGALAEGEYTKEPLPMSGGFSVFKKGPSRDAVPPTYEESKQILQSLLFQEEAMKLVNQLERQKDVSRFNEDGTPAPVEETAPPPEAKK